MAYDERASRRIDGLIADWATNLGLFPGQSNELPGYRFGTFAAMTHPDAVDDDHLLLTAQNMTALFAVDDHYCDEGIEGARLSLVGSRLCAAITALESGARMPDCPIIEVAIADDPVTRALRETAIRMARLGTPMQAARLRHESIATFLAMAAENSWRIAKHIPRPAQYLAHRKYNGAMACLALIDVAAGYELAARDWENPRVRSLSLIASTVILLVNDLYSIAKESADIGSQSLPTVLSARHGWALHRGMAETARVHDYMMRDYLRLEPQIAEGASTELTRYLNGLRNWMRGNLEWHSITGRHNMRDGRPTTSAPQHSLTHEDISSPQPHPERDGLCPHCSDDHTPHSPSLR
jgi:2-methylisoborneol synthase